MALKARETLYRQEAGTPRIRHPYRASQRYHWVSCTDLEMGLTRALGLCQKNRCMSHADPEMGLMRALGQSQRNRWMSHTDLESADPEIGVMGAPSHPAYKAGTLEFKPRLKPRRLMMKPSGPQSQSSRRLLDVFAGRAAH